MKAMWDLYEGAPWSGQVAFPGLLGWIPDHDDMIGQKPADIGSWAKAREDRNEGSLFYRGQKFNKDGKLEQTIQPLLHGFGPDVLPNLSAVWEGQTYVWNVPNEDDDPSTWLGVTEAEEPAAADSEVDVRKKVKPTHVDPRLRKLLKDMLSGINSSGRNPTYSNDDPFYVVVYDNDVNKSGGLGVTGLAQNIIDGALEGYLFDEAADQPHGDQALFFNLRPPASSESSTVLTVGKVRDNITKWLKETHAVRATNGGYGFGSPDYHVKVARYTTDLLRVGLLINNNGQKRVLQLSFSPSEVKEMIDKSDHNPAVSAQWWDLTTGVRTKLDGLLTHMIYPAPNNCAQILTILRDNTFLERIQYINNIIEQVMGTYINSETKQVDIDSNSINTFVDLAGASWAAAAKEEPGEKQEQEEGQGQEGEEGQEHFYTLPEHFYTLLEHCLSTLDPTNLDQLRRPESLSDFLGEIDGVSVPVWEHKLMSSILHAVQDALNFALDPHRSPEEWSTQLTYPLVPDNQIMPIIKYVTVHPPRSGDVRHVPRRPNKKKKRRQRTLFS